MNLNLKSVQFVGAVMLLVHKYARSVIEIAKCKQMNAIK